MCARDAVFELPAYLDRTMTSYLAEVKFCKEPVYPLGYPSTSNVKEIAEFAKGDPDNAANQYCKKSKLR